MIRVSQNAPSPRPQLLVEELETRILYSADAAALLGLSGAQPGVAEVRLFEPANDSPAATAQDLVQAAQARELIFIDSRVPDAIALADELVRARGGDRLFDIVMLQADADGVTQISEVLAAERGLAAIHIISHGSDGAIQIGDGRLDADRLGVDGASVARWGEALAAGGDLLLYGCQVAGDAAGLAFVQQLALLTGADVAASTDATGSEAQGGNWTLEHATGRIETALAFNAALQQSWAGTLGITTDPVSSAATVGAASSLSFTHTVGSGANRLLVVELAIGSNEPATSVEYGGVSLTLLAAVNDVGGQVRAEMWYLLAPTSGNATVSVTLGNTEWFTAGATSFANVDQLTPLGTPVTASGSGGSPSVTVASSVGDLVLDVVSLRDRDTASVDPAQTALWAQTTGNGVDDAYGASSTRPGAASVTTNWTSTGDGGGEWAAIAVALEATAAPVLTTSGSALAYVEHQAATPIDAGLNVSDADSPTLTGATVRISANHQIGADQLAFTNQSGISGSWNATTGVLTLSGSASVAQYQAALRSVAYQNTSDDPGALTRTVSFQVNDGALDSAVVTVSVNVTPVNDAPVLDNSGTPTLPTITKSQTSNGGQTVAGIIASAGGDRITDIDSGALEGIAVTALISGNGTWQYSIDGGGSWTGIGAVSGTSALLLRDSDLVRFVPNGVSPTTASFDFRAWDRSTGSFGTKTDASATGGSSAYSTAVETAGITVVDINSAPVLDSSKSPSLTAISEDAGAPAGAVGSLVSQLLDFATPAGQVDNVSDADPGAALGIAITAADTSQGSWFYSINNGATWNALGAVSTTSARLLAADATTRIVFQPNANVHSTLPAAITFHAWDQSSGANGAAASLLATQTVLDRFSVVSYGNNDGTAAWSSSWVEIDSPGNVPDNGSIRIVSSELRILPAWGDHISRQVNLAGAVSATLSYRFDSTAMTSGSVAVQVSSDGGASYATLKTHASGNLGTGTDTFDISAYASATTRIRFLATSSAAGSSRFMYVDDVQVSYTQTAGGNSAFSSASDTASLVVNPVADAPSVTPATTREDTQSSSGLVITRNAADGAEVTHYKITSIANGTLHQNDGVTTIADGSFITAAAGGAGLKFTPASNFNGVASFTVQAATSGSDAGLGGATVNASITVQSVNDAPAGTSRTVTTLEDTAHAFTLADFGFGDASDTPGNTLIAVRISSLPAAGSLTWNNGSSDVAVAVGQFVSAADIAAGRLRFTPAADANGTGHASFGFQVQDDGGTANGGVDLDPSPNVITIDVTPVNDAPTLGAGGTLAYTENQVATAVDPGVTVGDIDHATLAGATVAITSNHASGQDGLVFVNQNGISGSWDPAGGVLTLTGAASVAHYQAALRSVAYANASDNPSTAARSVTFTVSDGSASSAGAVATVSVAAVNDAPTATNLSAAQTYSEDNPLALTPIVISDVDSATASATLTLSNPAAGSLNTATSGSVTSSWNAATGVWSASGAIADVNALLAALVFTPAADASASFSITTRVSDGVAPAVTGSKAMTGIAINDAPLIVTSNSSLAYPIGTAAAPVDAALTITDVDHASLGGASVAVVGGYVSGPDQLSFTAQSGISGSWNPATGTLNLTGTATVAQYQAALRSVTFHTTSTSSGARLISFIASDGSAASEPATRSVTVGQEVPALWLSSVGDSTTSAGTGGLKYSDGEVVRLANPNLALGAAASNGSFTSVFDIDRFAAGNTNLNGLHVVHGAVTIGSVNPVALQRGDILLTTKSNEVLGGVAVSARDIVMFRPTTAGDYSSGSFSVVLRNPLGGTDLRDFALVETPMTIGSTALQAGDFLIIGSGGAYDKDISLFRPANMSTSPTGGTLSVLIDGDSSSAVDFSKQIYGLELVQHDTQLGGVTLRQGQLLVTVNGSATVGSNDLPVEARDIFVLNVTATGHGTSSGVATMFMRGTDLGLTGGSEELDALALVGVYNTAPLLDVARSPALLPVSEDSAAPVGAVGTLVSSLVDFKQPAGQNDNVTDPDTDAQLGIAIIVADTSAGSWWYSTDNGAAWNPLGAVSNASAKLLAADASTRLYFRPNADFAGSISSAITFRAWDRTVGTNGLNHNTSANGGATAFSADFDGAQLTVSAINDAPVRTSAAAAAIVAGEDSAAGTSASLGLGSLSYAPGGGADEAAQTLTAHITAIPPTITLWLADGTTAVPVGSTLTMAQLQGLRYRTVADAHGAALLGWTIRDSGGTAGGGTDSIADSLSITITPVNDAPVLTGSNELDGINQNPTSNAGTLVSDLLAGRVSDADAGAVGGIAVTAVDNTNGSWQYSRDGGTSWTAFGTPSVGAARLLAADASTSVRFSPNANWVGQVSPGLTFRAWDQTSGSAGSTADTTVNGATSAFSSAIASAAIQVSAWPVIFTGSYLENFTGLGTSGTQMAVGYRAMLLSGTRSTYDAANPISAAGIAGATVGNQNLLVWKPGDPNIESSNRIANAGSIGNLADRALATGPWTNGGSVIELALRNATDGPLASIQFGYDMKVLANGENGGTEAGGLPGYSFFYSLTGGTSAAEWIGVPSLATTSTTVGSVTSVSARIDFASPLAVGSTMFFRWADDNMENLSPDQNFAVDNVSVQRINTAPVLSGIEGGPLVWQEEAAATPVSSTLAVADVDDASLNGATVAITANYASGQDLLVFSDQNGISGSWDAASGVLTLTGSSSLANYQAALRSVAYLNTSDAPSTLSRTVTFSARDAGATSNLASRTVDVVARNDAPLLTGSNNLPAINRNPASNPGMLVADLLTGKVNDPDAGGALRGIAVTAVDNSNGSWQYSTDGGTNWIALGAPGDANARLLAADATSRVRFVPATDWSGSVIGGLRFRAWDQTTGSAGAIADVRVNGGSTAFSSTSASASISVGAANTAPVLGGANALTRIAEDAVGNTGTSVAALVAGQISDADPGAQAGIAVTAVDNSNGSWQYSTDGGSSWLAFGAPSSSAARLLAADASSFVRFVPAADFNGTVGAGITFKAWDRSSGLAGATADLSSILTVRDEFDTVAYDNDDGSARWSTPWLDVDDGPVGGSYRVTGGRLEIRTNNATDSLARQVDLSGATSATLSFGYVSDLNNGSGGRIDIQVSNNGGTSYTSLASFTPTLRTGTGSFSADISAWISAQTRIRFVTLGVSSSEQLHVDNLQIEWSSTGGGAHAFSSASAAASITVDPVNDAPVRSSAAPAAINASEDSSNLNATPFGLTGLTYGPGGASDEASQALSYTVTSVPPMITAWLADGTTPVSAGTSLTLAQLRGLTYRTVADANGSGSLNWTVRDSGGTALGGVDSLTQSLAITITPVNDAPVIAGSGATPAHVENQAATAIDPTLTLGDIDSATLASARVTITANFAAGEDRLVFADQNGIMGSFDAAAGVLSLSGVSSVANYQAALRSVAYLNTSEDPVGLTRTVSFVINDGALSSNVVMTNVAVTPVNDAPVAAAGGSPLAYTENQAATPIDPALTLADVDDTVLAGATVRISSNFVAGEDGLVFTDQNGIVGSFDPATGVLELSGPASLAHYQAALRSVAYLNTSDNPSGLTRTLAFTVSDGALASNVATTAVSVAPVNDAPVATAGGGSLAYVENQSARPVDPALTLADPDNATLASATVRISSNFASGEDRLVFVDQNGISGSFDTASGVLSLTGASSVADYQAALRSVAYLNTSDDPSAMTRTVTFTVSDGALASNPASRDVLVTPVNDAPVATTSGGGLAYVENQPATAVDPALTLVDLDNTGLVSATVRISNNFASGEDRLVFADQNGISGSFDPSTGVLSLTGAASVANYQAALRSVAYLNTSDDPGALTRTVSFTVSDGALDSNPASRDVLVTPVNDAPVTSTSGGNLAYTENQTATAIDPALTLADVDSTTLASASVRISGNFASGEDHLVFVDQNGISGSFDASTGVLSLSGVASVSDYQAALRSVAYRNTSDDPGALDRTVTFTVSDGALGSNQASRVVRVTPVNDAPVTATSGGSLAYVENQAGTAVDPALTLADVDSATLVLATVRISSNFAAGEDRLVFADQNGITGIFDAATGVLNLSGPASVAHYQTALRSVAYLNTSDDPGALTRTVTFTVSDGALASSSASRTVSVSPVNDAPVTSTSGGSAAYTENQPATPIDPDLTLADLDSPTLASAVISISGNFAAGEDRLVFVDQNGITGSFDASTGMLRLNGVASVAHYQAALRSVAYLNSSEDPSALTRTVSFSVDDGALGSNLANRTVQITPANDAPTITNGGGTLDTVENQAATPIDSTIILSDLDHATLASARVAITGNFAAGEDRLVFVDHNGITGSFDALSGVLSLSGVASVADYQAALQSVAYLNTSDDPSALVRTVSFSVADGLLASNTVDRDVRIAPVNDAPVTTAGGGALAYTENQAGTAVDPALTLADPDSTTLASAVVAISGNFAAGEDRLVFVDQNGISGSFDALSGVLSLSGVASVADYQAAMRSVAYLNTSDDPSALTRTVSFSVNDGALGSNVSSRGVSFTAVNDAPVTTTSGGSLAYVENQAATAVDPALTLSDLDNTTLASATVAITGNFAAGEDRLVFANQNGISGSFDASTGVLSLSGVASLADYQAALRSVAYLNTSDDPSALTRTVSFAVSDGTLGSNVSSRSVSFTAVNDAPVTTTSGGSMAYIENQAATAVDPALTLSDLDNTTLASATIAITGNFAAGEDRLVFANQNGISGSFDASTGVLSLSGIASVADYQAALRSATYLNTSDNPSALTRTISFSVNDGALGSNVSTRSVSFTAVNDAPVATTSGGSLAYVENQASTAVDPALTLSDLDNPTLASATIAITGNFAAGEDRLVFANQNGISGSFDASSGVLSLSGIASVADYQAALRSATYLNTSDNPSALTRTISFSVNDGALGSNVSTRSVSFTAVNDAPVATTSGGSLAYVENQASTAVDPALTLSDLDNTTIASTTIAITGNFAAGEDRLVFANQNGISGSFDTSSGILSLSGVASVADYQAALRSVAYLNTSDDPSDLTRTISFSVNDGSLDSNVATRTVGFTAVNDAPVTTTSGGSLAYVENQAATAVDPGLTLGDLDDTTLASATIAITGNFAAGEDRLVFADQNGISGSFDASTGVLSLSGVASVADYQAALRSIGYLNTSDDPSALTRTISFTVNDGALGSNVSSRSVSFTAVNDAPVTTTSGGSMAYIENQAATAVDPALTLGDLDNTTLASATVTIGSNFAAGEDRLVFTDQNGISGSFDASTGVLSLSGVASLADYQAALRSVAYLNTSDDPSALTRTISFSVNDGAIDSNVASRSVSFTAVNDAPVATTSGGSLAYIENQAATAVDPALTLSDLDNTTLASATVSITGNFAAGEDRLVFANQNGISGSFDASGGILSLSGVASVADYQAALRSVAYLNTSDDPSDLTRTISFSLNDGALDSNVSTRSVSFTAVNDAPVATTSGGSLAYVENQASTAVDPALTLSDLDNTTIASTTIAITGNFAAGEDRLVFANQNGISGSFDASTGVLSLSGVASVADYQAALRSVGYLNTSDDPSALTRTVAFSVNDGALGSNVSSRSVSFTAVNDAPVTNTSAGTLAYVENQAATAVDPALTLGELDNTTLASATVAITGNFAAGEDRLVFVNQSGISGSFDALSGVLSLSGVASVADYQAALRSVAYLNTSDDPSALTRTVSFSVNDGALGSNVSSRSVSFTTVNDAPVTNTSAGTLAYVENQAATAVDPALTLGDLDNTTLASATVAITGNFAAGEDRLVFVNQSGISGSFDALSGVLSLSGVASVADYQAALRSVAYLNTSDDPSALTRTVSFSVNDGALDSNVSSRGISFRAVNDAPVTTTSGGSLAYVENQAATAVDPALTLSDLDNTTLASATIAITGNFAAGEDRLVFTDQNGISGSFDASTGVLSLSGVASVADYQAALRSVAYLNTSDDPSALTRTVSFSVNDGALGSNVSSRSVSFTAVNDAPVATTSGGSLAYTENQAATAVDPALTLSDLDSTMLASATVSITGNFAAGEDRLVFTDQNGISGSFDASTSVLSLSGVASVADYQAALRSVAYLNTSDDPSDLTRTISFSVNDGALDSNVAIRTIAFTAVNDAPQTTTSGGSLAYTENQAATAVDPALTLSDLDNTTLASATIAITGNFAAGEDRLVVADQNGISGSFDGLTGVLSLSGVASVADYQAALRSVAYLNTSDDPSDLTRTISFSVNDGALESNVASRTIGFTAVNDAAVTQTSGGSLAYTENQTATAVDPALTLSDLDNTTLASATVSITGDFAAGEDRLVFVNQSGISGSFDALSGVLSLTGVASIVDYQAALRAVAYLNTSDDPSDLTRTISFSVNDGALDSNVAIRTVGFTAVNDAPVTTTSGGSIAFTENQAATALDPALTLSDLDNTTLASATVRISGNFAAGEDRLVFADQNGISGSFDATSGVLSLSGVASVADYQAALRSVDYLNTSDDPSALTRTISFSVNDGALASNMATPTIAFTAVNDAPVTNTSAGTLAYIENQAATAVDPALTLGDLDNTTLASATVSITGNFAAGEDRLVFANQNGISGNFDASTGVLSLSGVASVADYQAALRSIAYLNTSDDPSALTRTISFSVNDGALDSNMATRSIAFTAINDAPVTTTSGGTLEYTENQAATPIDPTLTLADLDNVTLASAVVSISSNFVPGEDRLVFIDQNGIVGSFDASSGMLRLSGTASVADYQAALRSVAYLNTSDDPAALTRTVSFSVADGALDSATSIHHVSVVAVGDPPTTRPIVLTSIREDSGPRTITQSELLASASDPDSASLRAEQLVIATGRGQLVDNGDGSWTYTPAADDDSEVVFSYIISDPVLTTAGRALLDIEPVDDAPRLALATLPVQGGSRLVVDSRLLQANDTDNLASTLSFVVVDILHGRFESADAPGTALERFTQSDVDAGRIVLVSTSGSEAPDFRIAAYDGHSYSGMIVAKVDFRRTAFASPSGDAGVVLGPPSLVASLPVPGSNLGIDPPATNDGAASKSAQSAGAGPGTRQRTAAEAIEVSAVRLDLGESGLRASERSLSQRSNGAERLQRPRAATPGEAQLDLATRISVDDYVTEATEFELLELSQQQRSGSGRGVAGDARSESTGASEEAFGQLDLGQAAAASGLVLSAGTIWWALRAGSLLTGLMVSLPAWRHADLLAVLPDEEDEDAWESAEDHESARDERAVDRVFESGAMGDRR